LSSAVAGLTLGLATACVVEDPQIESTEVVTDPGSSAPGGGQVGPTATPATPQFQPTVPPAPSPTPAPTVPPTPEATATPIPPPTPAATPLPAEVPADDSTPSLVLAGPVSVPVGEVTTFELGSDRPILQLPGHTLIYLDDNRLAEVDVFTPVAAGTGTPLGDYAAVIAHIESDPVFSAMDELDPVSIAGSPSRVFEGLPGQGDRGFYTDIGTVGNDLAGWFPPLRLRMWVIEAPRGPIIVTAESLEDPGQFTDAVRLATEILTSITFAP
jgi:hypothetical protein